MPIDQNFPKGYQVIGKHKHFDGQNYHYVWGPGKLSDAAENESVVADYATRNEELVPLGVHGTMVAVDWDACYAEGACIEVCPVKLYEWYRTDIDIPAVQMANATSSGNGSDNREGRVDYTDKSDPIRERDCIWCMACVAVCPPQAIKVEQSNVEFHEKANQTFREEAS